MKGRRNWFGLAFAGLAGPICGCHLLHPQGLRSQGSPPALSQTEEPGADPGTPPKGFFKPTRRSGALSSEAREIEANLGVPR